MSSHMFEEVEDTCGKVAMIKDGKIIAVKSTDEIKHNEDKVYKIEFASDEGYRRFATEAFYIEEYRENQNQVLVHVRDTEINHFLSLLKRNSDCILYLSDYVSGGRELGNVQIFYAEHTV